MILLFFYLQNRLSLNQLKIVNVYIEPASLRAVLEAESSNSQYQINVKENEAIQVFTVNNSRNSDDIYPYFKFPKNYSDNQLKSYGGYIRYTVRYEGNGETIGFIPDIILIVRDISVQIQNNNLITLLLFHRGTASNFCILPR